MLSRLKRSRNVVKSMSSLDRMRDEFEKKYMEKLKELGEIDPKEMKLVANIGYRGDLVKIQDKIESLSEDMIEADVISFAKLAKEQMILLEQRYEMIRNQRAKDKSMRDFIEAFYEWKLSCFIDILSEKISGKFMAYEAIALGNVDRKASSIENVVELAGGIAELFIPFGGIAKLGAQKLTSYFKGKEAKKGINNFLEFYEYGGIKKMYEKSRDLATSIGYELEDTIKIISLNGMDKLSDKICMEICRKIKEGIKFKNMIKEMKCNFGEYEGENGNNVKVSLEGKQITKEKRTLFSKSLNKIRGIMEVVSESVFIGD